jgi:recombination protein RecT
MSESLNELILSTQPAFLDMDRANGSLLDFKQECMFARQQITKNDTTTNTAANNPTSLKSAILNVAAIGISLNPALAHAYLVPRDGKICLDISYRGLVKLATDCGAIKWAKTELVYANDEFTWNGVNSEPDHKADVFGDRGDVVGGYCLAKLPDGTFMVEIMKRAEMDKIQATSKAANGPWKVWPDEMRKKSVTKRASKSWPQTDNISRVATAISVLNEHEGDQNIAPVGNGEDAALIPSYTDAEHAEYKRCIDSDDYFNLFALKRSLGVEGQSQLHDLCVPKADRGLITKAKQEEARKLYEAELKVDSTISLIREYADAGDDAGVQELIQDMSQWTLDYVLDRVNQEQRIFINKIREAA